MSERIIKERLNLYICQHGCHNVTVDVDRGVTPFMIPCQFTGREDRPLNPALSVDGKCIGMAQSQFYPRNLPEGIPYPVPTHEWYRPTTLEGLTPGEFDHVEQGGLLLSKRTEREMLLHED